MVMVGPPGWGVNAFVDKQIKEHGLEEKVLRLGFVPDEDMPGLYSLADMVMVPSFMAGSSLVMAEAMAVGTPVLASAIQAHQDVGGNAVLYCSPDDLPGMREGMEAILLNPGKQTQMVESGREQVADMTWRAHAMALRDLYAEVVAADQVRNLDGASP